MILKRNLLYRFRVFVPFKNSIKSSLFFFVRFFHYWFDKLMTCWTPQDADYQNVVQHLVHHKRSMPILYTAIFNALVDALYCRATRPDLEAVIAERINDNTITTLPPTVNSFFLNKFHLFDLSRPIFLGEGSLGLQFRNSSLPSHR